MAYYSDQQRLIAQYDDQRLVRVQKAHESKFLYVQETRETDALGQSRWMEIARTEKMNDPPISGARAGWIYRVVEKLARRVEKLEDALRLLEHDEENRTLSYKSTPRANENEPWSTNTVYTALVNTYNSVYSRNENGDTV